MARAPMYANHLESVGSRFATEKQFMLSTVREYGRDERQFIRAPEYTNVREPTNDQLPRDLNRANCQKSSDNRRFGQIRRNVPACSHKCSAKPYATYKTSQKAPGNPNEERKPKLKQSLVHTNSALGQEFMEYLEYYRCLKAGRFDCQICSARLSTRQGLIQHWSHYHSDRERPKFLESSPHAISQQLMAHCKAKKCIVCGSQCESVDKIKFHLLKFHDVEIHVCPVGDCSNAYLHKESLNKHVTDAHRRR